MANELSKKAQKMLNLEELTKIETPEKAKNLAFIGTGIATIAYNATVVTPEHYLLKNDPFTEPGEMKSATLSSPAPENATHYFVGEPLNQQYEGGEHGRYKQGVYQDLFPITFFARAKRKR